MKLTIRWQRLVDDRGQTCDRCARTGDSVQVAVETLREALEPLGIAVVAEERTLAPSEFTQAPLESNRIWIADKPLEEWLGAEAGRSPCCGSCGEHEYRTLYVKEHRYEVIPEELLLKAGLIAAARLIDNRETGARP